MVRALEYAQAAGISNCSVDVMLALPGQTEERLAKTAEFLRSLPVRHLSAYLLKVEEGTPFASLPLELPGEEAAARQYLLFCRLAERMGFLQYEISNFCPARL